VERVTHNQGTVECDVPTDSGELEKTAVDIVTQNQQKVQGELLTDSEQTLQSEVLEVSGQTLGIVTQ
jgi:hypothetical protein